MRDAIDFYRRAVRDGHGCLIWQGAIKSNGYGNVNYSGRTWTAHRLSYLLSHGEIPDGARVLHACDIRACVEPSHLHLGTAKQNSAEMVQRNRYVGPAKLSPSDRARVMQLVKLGEPQRLIAEQFGVSQATVSNIARGRHTALGDARWAQRIYDAVMNGGAA